MSRDFIKSFITHSEVKLLLWITLDFIVSVRFLDTEMILLFFFIIIYLGMDKE